MENNKYPPTGAFDGDGEEDSTPKWQILFFLAVILPVCAWERVQSGFGNMTEEGRRNYGLFYTGTIMAITVFPLWKYKILAIGSAPLAVAFLGWALLSMVNVCDPEGVDGFGQDSENFIRLSALFAVPTAAIALFAFFR